MTVASGEAAKSTRPAGRSGRESGSGKTRPLHALLIHQAYSGPTEPGGTRHFELASRMVKQGHHFTVIASDVSYLTGEKTSGEGGTGLDVRRVFGGFAFHRGYFFRVMAFLAFTLCAAWEGLRVPEVDVVIATTPPIFQALAAVMIGLVRRRPLLLEVRDLWPEFAIDIGVLKNPFLIWIARRLETFLYARACHIVVNSPAYCDYLRERGIPAEKISLVANGVDPGMFEPEANGSRLRERWSLTGKFVVTYAGAMGMANDLDVILGAAELLRAETDVMFVLAGDGKERPRLQEIAATRGLANILFTGPLPKHDIPELLAASDACIATLKNIAMFRTTYPNKVFDYMAAGRPTVLGIDGVIREVMEKAEGGIFAPPGDEKAVASAVLVLKQDRPAAREMGRKAREYVFRHFHRDEQAREFAGVIRRMAAPA